MSYSTVKEKTNAGFRNAEELKDDLQDAAHKAGRKVRNIFDTATHEIAHAGETVTDEIRSNPVRSSVIALGVGVALGMLLRR